LKLSFTNTYTERRAEIYRLSTGSWSDVKLEGYVTTYFIETPVHVNGIFHWSGCNPGESNTAYTKVIRSFDLKNEKFGSVMVPSCLRHGDDMSFFPWTFRESLCLIDDPHDGPCRVWVMKEYGVSDSWQNLFVIDTVLLDISNILYFRHNEEVISELSGCTSILVSYDCNNKRGTDIKLLGNPNSVHTYVESLALINIPNKVKIDEESTNIPKIIRGFSDLTLN
jgi:F-box interacting protein